MTGQIVELGERVRRRAIELTDEAFASAALVRLATPADVRQLTSRADVEIRQLGAADRAGRTQAAMLSRDPVYVRDPDGSFVPVGYIDELRVEANMADIMTYGSVTLEQMPTMRHGRLVFRA